MKISEIVIEGEMGPLAITATYRGAMVVLDHEVLAEFGRDEDRKILLAKAVHVAGYIYGTRRGVPKATNSEIHAVLSEIERVAGC